MLIAALITVCGIVVSVYLSGIPKAGKVPGSKMLRSTVLISVRPQNAIDDRGYADFAPLGHSVRVLREEEKGTISWKIIFRDGREKNFVSPIRTTPWGSIPSPADQKKPARGDFHSQELALEPEYLKIDGGLSALQPDQFRQGVV